MSSSRRVVRQRRRRRRQRRSPRWGVRLALLGLVLLAGLAVATVTTGVGAYVVFAQELPSPEAITTREISQTTRIYDRNGVLLSEIFDPEGSRRTLVPLSAISPYLVEATVATEDADFYSNPGLNWRGLARAVVYDVLNPEVAPQGGSSITQQLVKNVLIPEEERFEVSLDRKVKEAILAFELTRRYSKDTILEWYLNEICYGNLSCGVESAAQTYFGKSASALTLGEASLLAGLPQAPSLYSPYSNLPGARYRQGVVLDSMVRQGYITEAQAEQARAEELDFKPTHISMEAPHFVMYVRALLEKRYGARALYRGGLRVTTSLDLKLQETAVEAIRSHLQAIGEQDNAHNAALAAIDPHTGEVLVMVGSADFFDESIDGQVNMALAERQPGSSFKPFTYVTALQQGYTPATMVLDVPVTYPNPPNEPYAPRNVDNKFRGPVSVRYALANSLNIPAVRVLADVGVSKVLDTAHRMGITSLEKGVSNYGLALTLGGGEVKLLDMVYAFGVFANEGRMAGQPVSTGELRPGYRRLEPVSIIKVEDSSGRVLEQYTEPLNDPIAAPGYAYLITHILSDNQARLAIFGPNNALQLAGRPAAAKTGTTTDYRDAWTIGYTPELVAGVWVGNADNQPMTGSYGSRAAAPIWKRFMEGALAGNPPSQFVRPPGIVEKEVCYPSGLLPTPQCPDVRREVFLEGTQPTQQDNVYQLFRIDRATGLLANQQTPANQVEQKVYMVLPPEADDWMRDAGIPQPPAGYSPSGQSSVLITSPRVGDAIAGLVEVRGSARSDDFTGYSLEYGPGVEPTTWASLQTLRREPVADGVLGYFNTQGLEGLYTLRLSVIDGKRGRLESRVPLTVDNTKPQVSLSYPTDGAVLKMLSDGESMGLLAQVTDNGGVGRVEFFVDGQSIGLTTVYPYGRPWKPTLGEHTIFVRASDKAGNVAESPVARFRVVASR